jgi:Tol biopolymer transport system component
MLTPEGHVKVMDFGLAKRVTPVEGQDEDEITTKLTRDNSFLGTVPYMSPEQLRGQEVDTRSDIFSFGVVLYEMLAGVHPFKKVGQIETANAILSETQPPLSRYTNDVPGLLQHTVKKMLAKEPDRRYQLIHDVRTDLAALVDEIEELLAKPTAVSPTGVGSAVQAPLWRRAIPWGIATIIALTAIVTVWILTRPSPEPVTKLVITPPSTAPLANSEGIDVAISPDGRNIVYVAEREGTTQLYLHPLDQFTPTPVSGTEGAGPSFFSPDGESVAFFTSGELKRVSLQGGLPITIGEVPYYGYGNWGSEDIIVFSPVRKGSGLYRVLAGGGEPESLALPDTDKGESYYAFPQILPGGSTVLFTIFGRGGWQIAVLSLESREQKILLEGGRQARYVETGHLVYEVPVSGGLMGVPFDLENLEVTGDPVLLLQGIRYNPSDAVDYAFSSSGTLAYVPLPTDEQTLVWVDREGTESMITQEKGTFGVTRISPDGRQVSISVFEDDGSRNVWIYSFDGDSFSRLTFEGDFNTTQTWSPDGKWIAFQSGREGLRALYRQLADGSGPPQQLTTLSQAAQIPDSWSPDGSVLAFTQAGEIWELSMDGDGKPQPLLNSPNYQCCAAFSPDGHSFAYVLDERGQRHVYISPYPKPNVKWQVSGDEGGGEPVWSPDGRELFYRSGDKMLVVSVEMEPSFSVGKPRVLFEGSYVTTQFTPGKPYYDISPDGQRFVMIRAAGEAQINVVLNWFEELKRLVPTN